MALQIASINSGSNGNCYYIGNDNEAILIDAGISCREIEKRMKRLNLSINNIKAIFVSHEHSDHVKGVYGLSEKFKLPVYITTSTRLSCGFKHIESVFKPYTAHEKIHFGSLSITAFPKFHDACDPYSFIVSDNNNCVGVFTDIGNPCENVIRYFKQCTAAFLESNYDDKMLDSGNYPYHLKKRIRSNVGHLSNQQALELFKNYKSPNLTHLILSHLSKNNNCPNLVYNLFNNHAGGVEIIVASRNEESQIFHVNGAKSKMKAFKKPVVAVSQLTFAFS